MWGSSQGAVWSVLLSVGLSVLITQSVQIHCNAGYWTPLTNSYEGAHAFKFKNSFLIEPDQNILIPKFLQLWHIWKDPSCVLGV